MNISKDTKRQIIQHNINTLKEEQYNLEVRARVFKKVNHPRYDDAVQELERNQKMQDAYNEELGKIEKEKVA